MITWTTVGGYVNEVEGQVINMRGHVTRTGGDVDGMLRHVNMALVT